MTIDQVDQVTFEEDWRAWRDGRDKALGDPHGFLAVTAIHWLDGAPARFDDVPGAWATGGHGVSVDLAEGESLVVDGATVKGHYDFGVIAERASITATFGDAVVEVAKRGGRDIVRPRHPSHDLVQRYAGTPTYGPDPQWVVSGRFEPFDPPRAVSVNAAIAGLEHVYDAPGRIAFELRGQTHYLTAFSTETPGSLFLLFKDATSGVTTYAASRTLSVTAPDEEGRVVLDFNRAANLPCAYTDHATCPLAPRENTLPVAVEAGEQTPYERHGV
jgi:hypothetical protein